jgi:hypothetical protein
MINKSATKTPNDVGYIELTKCELVDGQFRIRGDKQRIGLLEAVNKFTPTQKIGSVVLKAKPGYYLGLFNSGKRQEAFLIQNTNDHGDISWLIKKRPAFSSSISEAYMVHEVVVTAQKAELRR